MSFFASSDGLAILLAVPGVATLIFNVFQQIVRLKRRDDAPGNAAASGQGLWGLLAVLSGGGDEP